MRRFVLLIVLIGLGATGCGSGGASSPATTAGGTTATSATATSGTTTSTATTPTTTSTTTRAATTTVPSPVPTCSAAGLSTEPAEQNLPEPVAAKRAAIVAAAVACDYEALADLTGDPFTYSFGDKGDPAGYWRGLEASKDVTVSPLGALVMLLNLRHGINAGDMTYYVWPAAFSYSSWVAVPRVDKEDLRILYGDEDFASFARFGGYIGYRVSITSAGEWNAFVAGD